MAFSFSLFEPISKNDPNLGERLEFTDPMEPTELVLLLRTLAENTGIRSLKVTAVVGDSLTEEVIVALLHLIGKTQTLQSVDFGNLAVVDTFTPTGLVGKYTTESMLRFGICQNNSLMHFQVNIPEATLKIQNHLEHNKYLARAAAFFASCELEHAMAAEAKNPEKSLVQVSPLKMLHDQLREQHREDRPISVVKLRNQLLLVARNSNNQEAKKIIQDILDFIKYLEIKKTAQETALHIMARYGFRVELEKLITECRIPVNGVDVRGRSPIFDAVLNSRYETVKRLMELKADVTIRTPYGQDALHFAKRKNDQKMMEILGHKTATPEQSSNQNGLDSKQMESYRRVAFVLGSAKLKPRLPEKEATEIAQFSSSGQPAQTVEMLKIYLQRYIDECRFVRFGQRALDVKIVIENILAVLNKSPSTQRANTHHRAVPFIMCNESAIRQNATEAIKTLNPGQRIIITHLGCSGHVYAACFTKKAEDFELALADRGLFADSVPDAKQTKVNVVRMLSFDQQFLDEVMIQLTDASECSESHARKMIFKDMPAKVGKPGFMYHPDVWAKLLKEGKCFTNVKTIVKFLLITDLGAEEGHKVYKDITTWLRTQVVSDFAQEMKALGSACPLYVGKLVTFFAPSATPDDLYKELDILQDYPEQDTKPFQLLATKLEKLAIHEAKMTPEQKAVYAIKKAECYSMIWDITEITSQESINAEQLRWHANLKFVEIINSNPDLIGNPVIKKRLPFCYQELSFYYRNQFYSMFSKHIERRLVDRSEIETGLKHLEEYLRYYDAAVKYSEFVKGVQLTQLFGLLQDKNINDLRDPNSTLRKNLDNARMRLGRTICI